MKNATGLSFAADIRPMFTDVDVDHMKAYGMDLSDRDDVETHATDILSAVTSGAMPPAQQNRRWTKEMCDKFELWTQTGYSP